MWASRKWRIKKIKKYVDKVLCIFPFEVEMYKKEGVDAEFVGHPLLDEMPESIIDINAFFDENAIDKSNKLVSIFPGSRVFEVKNLLEIFLEAARKLKTKHDDLQFVLCQAPNIKDNLIYPCLDKYKDLNVKVLKNKNYELLNVSDALMLASGTVALEAALYETPMIISYKGPWFLYGVYLLVRCIKRVCLPNIILDKDIVPELIQLKAKAENVAFSVEEILYNENYRLNMINELRNVKQKLSGSNTAKKVATIISENI